MPQSIHVLHNHVTTKFRKRSTVWVLSISSVLIGLTVIVTTTTVAVHPWSRTITGKATERTTATYVAPTSTQNRERTVTLLPLQLREGGLVPRNITATAGDYELLITNISSEDVGTLRLERETGEHVDTIALRKGRNVRKLVRLTPGNYLLLLNKRRDWFTRITITER
jgi:hypothetical protein